MVMFLLVHRACSMLKLIVHQHAVKCRSLWCSVRSLKSQSETWHATTTTMAERLPPCRFAQLGHPLLCSPTLWRHWGPLQAYGSLEYFMGAEFKLVEYCRIVTCLLFFLWVCWIHRILLMLLRETPTLHLCLIETKLSRITLPKPVTTFITHLYTELEVSFQDRGKRLHQNSSSSGKAVRFSDHSWWVDSQHW